SGVAPTPVAPTASGTGSATPVSGPTPASQAIPGLGSVTFVWTYTAATAGTFILNGGAAGTDANSGAAVTASAVNSDTATIQTPAALSVTSFTITPSPSSVGQTLTATMTVAN